MKKIELYRDFGKVSGSIWDFKRYYADDREASQTNKNHIFHIY